MDLKELTTFQTVLQEGNFSKAAAKLNYAQSTITNQVQRLEKEVGIKLFKRGWDSELTASGRIFAAEIDSLIRHWNYVADQAKALQKEEIGTLRIGGLESLTEQILPKSLLRFMEHKPNVSCHFVIGNTASLSHALLQNQLDFAICGEPVDLSSYHFEPLYQERISFIAGNNHPLAAKMRSLSRNCLVIQSLPGSYLSISFPIIEAVLPVHRNSLSAYRKSNLCHCGLRPDDRFYRSRPRIYAVTAECGETPGHAEGSLHSRRPAAITQR